MRKIGLEGGVQGRFVGCLALSEQWPWVDRTLGDVPGAQRSFWTKDGADRPAQQLGALGRWRLYVWSQALGGARGSGQRASRGTVEPRDQRRQGVRAESQQTPGQLSSSG